MGNEDELAFDTLTSREREVLRLIAQHRRSKEIARLLRISPSTVELHVSKARKRLSNLGRRDAALAFVAWEATPSSNYHSGFSGLADRPGPALHEPEPEAPDADPSIPSPFLFGAHVPGDLGLAGRQPDAVGREPRTVTPGARDGLGLEEGAARWRTAFEAVAEDPQRHGLPRGPRRLAGLLGGGWIHDLTPLQLVVLAIGCAVLAGLLLGAVTMAAHNFLYAVGQWRQGWPAPGA